MHYYKKFQKSVWLEMGDNVEMEDDLKNVPKLGYFIESSNQKFRVYSRELVAYFQTNHLSTHTHSLKRYQNLFDNITPINTCITREGLLIL